ncbi:Hypp1722 [Branchiostoma lanceolatum]|uniref:Hypp1722 protein n=1 Tax=Branchiostoma lanceolatum TaxID=7740 RepID=A0A8K0EJV9_BRALA|nr:Hypp1722 [Branchiostoma lanceolatum]
MGASNTKHGTKHGTIRRKPGEKMKSPDRMDLIMEDACIALHLRVKQKVTKMSNLPTAVRDKHISIFLENLTSSKEFFQWELYQALRGRLSVKYWVRLHNKIFEDSDESLDLTVRRMNRRELTAVVEIRKAPVIDRLALKKDLGRLSHLIATGKVERGYLVVYGTFPKGFQPPLLMIDKGKVPPVLKEEDSAQTYSDDYLDRSKVVVTEDTDWLKVAEGETVAAGVAKFSMDLPGVVKLQPEKFRIRVYRVVHRDQDGADDVDDVTNPADVTESARTEVVTSTPRKPKPFHESVSAGDGGDVMATSPRKPLELPLRVGTPVDDATSTPRSLESPQVPAMGFTAEEKLEFRRVGLDLSPRKEKSPCHVTDEPGIEEISESDGEADSKL